MLVPKNVRPLLLAAGMIVMLSISGGAALLTGNVESWSRQGQEVIFNLSLGTQLRIEVLTDDMLRVRFSPTGTFAPNISHAVVKDDWPAVAFTAEDMGAWIRITTGALMIDVMEVPCATTVRDLNGNVICEDDPARRIIYDAAYTRVFKKTQTNEKYLGLGWRPEGGLVRNGTRFTMRNKPTYGEPDVFYGGIPFWYGMRDGKAYGILFNDASWGEINVGQANSSYMYFNNIGGQLEYFFFYGPEIATILDRYTELTGRPFFPPKWATGYQQCRWSYYPQSEVLGIAATFRNRSIPCDVMYLDIDYMDKGNQLSFNPSAFPNPLAMNNSLHGLGFHTIANIGPWLLEGSSKYNEAAAAGYLLKTSAGQPHKFWHDYIYFVMGAPTGWMAEVDFTNPGARAWYAAKHYPFLSYGIDGIWNDLNEPDELGGGAWPTDVKYNMGGAPTNHNKTSNQYCLFQSEFSYDVLATHHANQRPFVLSRGAFAGIQRAAAVWSGDNRSGWTDDFKRNIPMGLAMSLSGQPHNGHDIGGFFGQPDFSTLTDPELFARWMQAGVFSAFCRSHHSGNGVQGDWPHVEPWVFGATVESICKAYIELRYKLMPYMYSLFYQAHTTGAPVQRPTVYDFQHDIGTLTQDYDFMFGPYMLGAPVYLKGATMRGVYLPSGTGWTDWWTGTRYQGGQTIAVSAPLDRMPLFARDGAIIPMGPVMQHVGQVALTELTLRMYPQEGVESSFEMFEDDDSTFDYQSGDFALTSYTLRKESGNVMLAVAPRQGSFVPTARHYLAEVHSVDAAPQIVAVNGDALSPYGSLSALRTAGTGFYYDASGDILYARFADSGQQIHLTAGSDVTPPQISNLRPTTVAGSGIDLSASVTDAGVGVERVEFYVDGDLQATDVEPGPGDVYSFGWDSPQVGPHTVEARAFDLAQNQSSLTIDIGAVSSVGTAKLGAEGDHVALLAPGVVSAVFPSGDPGMKSRYVYVQDPDRAAGIRVRTDDAAIVPGSGLLVAGLLQKVKIAGKEQGELVIDASSASGATLQEGTLGQPVPLGVQNFLLHPMNGGLLARSWGFVRSLGQTDGYPYFYMDDGSPIVSGHDLLAAPGDTTVFQGVRVYIPDTTLLSVGDFVEAVGVSGSESPLNFSELNRVLRSDSESDVEVLLPAAP